MPSNRWVIGEMYQPGGPNGFFTQPGGPGTQVFPTQKNAAPWPEWPAAGGMIIQEYSPWWSPQCGHSIKMWRLIQEYDYVENESVMLVCCNVCTLVQGVLRPASLAYDPIQEAIIMA